MVADIITEKKTGKVRLRVETNPNLQPRLPIAESKFSKSLVEMAAIATMRCDCGRFEVAIYDSVDRILGYSEHTCG